MTKIGEIKEKGYIPPAPMVKLLIKGTLSLSKVLITNLGGLKKARYAAHYEAPKPSYEIPEYKNGMKYCNSNEKYLRPTLYCNPHAKEIIAMAHELGAFEKDAWEYANDAFEFVKRKVILEIRPMEDAVATLKRGAGTCLHMLNLYVALCRCAGIKARYKLYALSMIQMWYDTLVAVDPIMKKWYDAMGYFMIHGEAEVYINDEWLTADVAPTPERQAAAGIPITKLGDDPIGVRFFALPGTIMRMESLPLGLGMASKILMKKIAPGTVATINKSILQQIEKGRKILEEMGEEEYDKKARKTFKPKTPTLTLQNKEGLMFADST
ncbi:MAG: hypothetical protein DRN29_08335 [Thermoplasmata archaeon]|nr:MAG: hypothetical protein DRN29_08335 [Thermoplasmata archaeon]